MRHSRKWTYSLDGDKVKALEITEADPILDALSDDAARFRRELEGGLPPQFKPKIPKSIARWPIHSEVMAVDPENVPLQQAELARHGVKTDYDRLGRPILRDKAHRKAHARVFRFYDRNAGYSDPEPLYFNGPPEPKDTSTFEGL